ncbi:hypothetical protein GCM10020256_59000 [Streptomyces thermocoprophilus]
MPDDEDDRARQQGLADTAGGGLRFAAHHHQREDEYGDDRGLRGEVPRGDGHQRPAHGHESNEPLGPGQHGGEAREQQRAQHGPGRPAQHSGDERTEVGLDEEDDGRGQPVPVGVAAVPVGVVEGLSGGDAGAEAEGDAQPVLASAAPERDGEQVAGGAPPGVQLPAAVPAVEGLGGVQQGVVQGAQGGGRNDPARAAARWAGGRVPPRRGASARPRCAG